MTIDSEQRVVIAANVVREVTTELARTLTPDIPATVTVVRILVTAYAGVVAQLVEDGMDIDSACEGIRDDFVAVNRSLRELVRPRGTPLQ
jgi:hypothetical protein